MRKVIRRFKDALSAAKLTRDKFMSARARGFLSIEVRNGRFAARRLILLEDDTHRIDLVYRPSRQDAGHVQTVGASPGRFAMVCCTYYLCAILTLMYTLQETSMATQRTPKGTAEEAAEAG